jgi:hypothetical protein
MRRYLLGVISALAIGLALSATPVRANDNCGATPPSGRVAVRIGFLHPDELRVNNGQTDRVALIQSQIKDQVYGELNRAITQRWMNLCYLSPGALPYGVIPLLEMNGYFSEENARQIVQRLRFVLPGVRVYSSHRTGNQDWGDGRIPSLPGDE